MDWLSVTHNSFYLNKLRLTAELKGFGNDKGRGLIYLNSDARDLWIVGNGSQVFISVRSAFLENHACVAEGVIYRPGKYFCGANAVPAVIGKSCSGSWDLRTCSVVARGRAQPASTNRSVVLAENVTMLDSYLANAFSAFRPR